MNIDLLSLDLEILKAMYQKEEAELKTKLLHGALWHELKDQRKKVTDLAIVIHKKKSESLHNVNSEELNSETEEL